MAEMLITPEQLSRIAPTIPPGRAVIMSGLLNTICPKYGIDTKGEFHEFLGQVLHESGEFRAKTENMNYSAQRIRAVWPKRFPSLDFAQKYAFKAVELANFTYGGRMGNNRQGDGWRFRGGGFIGLTGREVYTKYMEYVNQRDRTTLNVGQVADLVRSSDEWALDSACWFFSVLKGLNDEAAADKQDMITLRINGGYIGKQSRDEYTALAKKIIV